MNTLHKTARLLILFIGILILSCQEEPQHTAAMHPQTNQAFVTAEKPEARAILQQVLNTSIANGRTQSTTAGELNVSEGVLLDSTNYSQYAFEYVNTGNRFENLIAIQENDLVYAYILQYDPDSLWLANSNTNAIDLENFTGYIRQLDLNRAIISENYIQGGKSMIDLYDAGTTSSGGRTENIRCCWQTVKSTATSLPMVIIKCDDGSQFELFGEDFANYAACSGNNGGANGGDGPGPSTGPSSPIPSPVTTPQPFNPRPKPIKGGGSGQGTSPSTGIGTLPPRGLLPRSPVVIGLTKKIYYLGSVCVDCIENRLKDPCLKKVADKVLNPGVASTFNKLIQDAFNSTDKVNLILVEGDLSDALGSTGRAEPDGWFSDIINVRTTLDPSKFKGMSQEYVAATIYHECFHALVNYLSDNKYSQDDDHVAIFTNYLKLLADALEVAFPNSMAQGDAKGLILKAAIGLEQIGDWSPTFVDKILSVSGYSRSQIEQIARKHMKSIAGTKCN
ncbi:MAG TPA: hypothetical protein VIM75_07220 [Ohtaekwangia sp.]|uniref:hypothetical protein n=1 Tax=Ohtaekwangia sp. TaxID=2066019 RepID=UPI002F9338DD